MSQKQDERLFGKGDFQNREEIVSDAGTTMDYRVKDSGTDTGTIKYLSLGRLAKYLVVRTDQIITIDEINGIVPINPITIAANTTFKLTKGIEILKFKVTTTAANTSLKILVI